MLNRLFIEHCYWVGIKQINNDDEIIDNINNKFCILKPSLRYYYADPLLTTISGKNYLFMEQYDRFKKKGNICVSEIKENKIGKPKTIIDESFHMSFPNVISFNGDYYMIPETSADHSIRIYKMKKDVCLWELVSKYEIDRCVDTASYINEKNEIYLITSQFSGEDPLLCRLAFFKLTDLNDAIFKQLQISTDYTYTNRNGGNIISINNIDYRVVQVSDEKEYGKKILINSVEKINDTEFVEKTKYEFNVDDFMYNNNRLRAKGTHTLSICNGYEAVDYKGEYTSILNVFTKAFRILFNIF